MYVIRAVIQSLLVPYRIEHECFLHFGRDFFGIAQNMQRYVRLQFHIYSDSRVECANDDNNARITHRMKLSGLSL